MNRIYIDENHYLVYEEIPALSLSLSENLDVHHHFDTGIIR